MDKTLRFYARGTALVVDPHAQERGIRRFIGRRWQEVLPGRWAWCPTGEPDAVAYEPDLTKAARDGDLWPADEETAKLCGVPFSSAFDEETTETIKAFKARLAAANAPKAEAPKAEAPKAEAPKGEPEAPKTERAAKAAGKGDV